MKGLTYLFTRSKECAIPFLVLICLNLIVIGFSGVGAKPTLKRFLQALIIPLERVARCLPSTVLKCTQGFETISDSSSLGSAATSALVITISVISTSCPI